ISGGSSLLPQNRCPPIYCHGCPCTVTILTRGRGFCRHVPRSHNDKTATVPCLVCLTLAGCQSIYCRLHPLAPLSRNLTTIRWTASLDLAGNARYCRVPLSCKGL